MKFHKKINPCQWRRVELMQPLPMSFSQMTAEPPELIVLIFCKAYGSFFAQLPAERIAELGQVMERCDKSNSPVDFSLRTCFSHVTCHHWLEWRHYAWFRSEDDYIWLLTLNPRLSKVIRGHRRWPTPCSNIVAKLVIFVFWGPQTEHVAPFSHRLVHRAPLSFPMSIRAMGPACPRMIYPVVVCSLPGFFTSQIFYQDAETTRHSVHTWTGDKLVKVWIRYNYCFVLWTC